MNPCQNIEEKLYWKEMVSGDEAAFSALFRKYHVLLVNFGKIYTVSDSLINDAVQDLFSDFWEKRKKLNPDVNVKSYIFGGFRNKLLKRINKRKGFVFREEPIEVEFELSYESLKIETEENKDKILRLNSLLNQLPPKQKEVIYLKYYKGLSNEQIAQILNINYQSVKNHVYRSIIMLRSYYGNEAKIN